MESVEICISLRRDNLGNKEKFINDETEFVFPNSAFTVEFYTEFKSNKVVICFDLPEGGQINEIKVLGKEA